MKRFIVSIVVVITTLVLLVVAWQLREAMILFVLSLALAAALRTPVNFWVRRGLSRPLGIILTYLLSLLVLAGLLLIVSGPVLLDLQHATDLFDRTYRQILKDWPAGTPFQQTVSAQLPPLQDLYKAIAGEQGTQLLLGVLGIASGFMANLANAAIVLMLSLYWSFDRPRLEKLWVSLLPVNKRRRARDIWYELENGVGGYIRSELLQSVGAGLLLGAGYYLMGLSFPALIAMIGALLWLIPWLGGGLALVLPLIAGLHAANALVIVAPAYTILVLVFLEMVVQPRIIERRQYSSLLIVIIMVAMAQVYGLLGLLLAPPLAAAIQTLYSSLRRPAPAAAAQNLTFKLNAVRQRVEGLREQVAGREEAPSPVVLSLLGRLTSVMEETGELIETAEPPVSLPEADLSPEGVV